MYLVDATSTTIFVVTQFIVSTYGAMLISIIMARTLAASPNFAGSCVAFLISAPTPPLSIVDKKDHRNKIKKPKSKSTMQMKLKGNVSSVFNYSPDPHDIHGKFVPVQ